MNESLKKILVYGVDYFIGSNVKFNDYHKPGQMSMTLLEL